MEPGTASTTEPPPSGNIPTGPPLENGKSKEEKSASTNESQQDDPPVSDASPDQPSTFASEATPALDAQQHATTEATKSDEAPTQALESSADAPPASPRNEKDPKLTTTPPGEVFTKEEPSFDVAAAADDDANAAADAVVTDTLSWKDANIGRLVEQTKVLPSSGQIATLPGQVVSFQPSEGRLPPRWAVQWSSSSGYNYNYNSSASASGMKDGEEILMHDEWMEEDLNPETPPPAGNLQWAMDKIQARYQEQLELELSHDHTESSQYPHLISTLLLYAAMEEALQTNLSIQQQQQQQPDEGSNKTIGNNSDPHPPLYYTTNPSSYLRAPTATDTMPTEPAKKVFMTPSSLAQRVRQGCQWAHRYLVAQQPPPPPLPSLAALHAAQNQRRSLRQPKPVLSATTTASSSIVPKPTPVQPGGRVAMWWIEQLEAIMAEGKEQTKENTKEKEGGIKQNELVPGDEEPVDEVKTKRPDTPNKVSPPDEDKQKSQKKENAAKDDAMEVDEEQGPVDKKEQVDEDEDNDDDDDESDNKPDDDEDDGDDDYGSKDAVDEHEEDEELEDVEKEREGNLSPVSETPMEEEEDKDSESKETDEDIQQEVLYNNPYLKPSFPSLLEYLARPKALAGEDVQKAMADVILRIKFNKRFTAAGLETGTLSTVDQVVLDQETPNYPPGKVVLKCVSEETFSELQKMEAQTFSRCKFALDVIGDEESSMQIHRQQELILQEIQYKEQKAWSKWRHKGIHEGYATWPSWHEAIAEWVKTNCSISTSEPAAGNDVAAPTASSSHTTDATAQGDEALAKSLEENEGTERRRTSRRSTTTASEGVFYGNQSQLTHKQLMDALIRLVRVNQFQTLLRLQSLTAEDSSDPIRRSRVAVGKLVWKRNLILRKSVDVDLSDAALVQSVAKRALLTIPPAVQETVTVIADIIKEPRKELSVEEKGLMKYIQNLHTTELRLRKMVTKCLAEIPVTIIATAADERPNSMESMDAADFEDPSSIEWHTSGHPLLKRVVFRPAVVNGNTNELTPCFWYQIQDFSKSIESDADDKEETDSKERRMRFRAVPIPPPGESWAEQETILILTEGQVHAGIKAAEIEKKNRASTQSVGNPFSAASGDKITLIPVDSDEGTRTAEDIHGRIIGYDNVILDDGDEVEYRILVLPESGVSREAFWASLDVRADTASYVCQPLGESTTWYSIEQFDFHPGSEAHQQCEVVLNWLGRQNKSAPFGQPVDPVALNIPTYPQIVKHPMDISTMAEKLENGQYSSILPGQTSGIGPVSRMLNGPFRKDVELIFDNAMLFNPPDDWIYQAAAHLKKNVIKKITDLSLAADQKLSATGRFRKKQNSVYVDDDSDVDMYEYESDNDEEFGKGRKRKRSARGGGGGAQKDELAARAIEHPIRLQNTLRDASNLRGPFANLPINLSASSFSLPPHWSCRSSTASSAGITEEKMKPEENASAKKRAQEMAELLEMQRVVEANESAGLRRSTRAQDAPISSGSGNGRSFKSKDGSPREYFVTGMPADPDANKILPSTRYEVEVQAEKLHEEYYSKLYQSYSSIISAHQEWNEHAYGVYSNGSFPPYLGRVVPLSSWEDVSWEIRSPFVVPALRWVLRGLIQSGHLTAIEDMTADFSSGVILTNDIYYWDSNLQPFEVLDLRELQRKKRATKENSEDSEDEVEMSEYEKARAERVARNADRLKSLGLA